MMQVLKNSTQADFESGSVQLSVAATARAGSVSNATMLQDSVIASVNVTQTPLMTASLALAPNTRNQVDKAGECACSTNHAVPCSTTTIWLLLLLANFAVYNDHCKRLGQYIDMHGLVRWTGTTAVRAN